ncbi:tyrosyl-tRNA synthetase [Pochonia chlamydosporia 170]|uniref:Tyrosine--tRNA ligase n=1 Tax=Pochonia chlamydosporia 170 TaxID=1380566 RepID=A0A179FTN3_METCM|nr:tyrosyl-tRNA synthetase [Pochonia chlamydosporia 170]OAQ68379.1 tyrosyl-tRNA synthetase [Pochonia chlamydosporia 170]
MAPRLQASRCLGRSGPRGASRCAAQLAWSACELQQIRGIATSYLNKVAEGEARWEKRAQQIQNGELPHVWDVLDERGYIKDVAGTPDKIKEVMRIKRIGAYVGVDPTADSLHIGHLLPFMPLFWLWFHGYPAVTLLGGATARIGDPTGRLQSRDHLSNSEISKNVTKIHFQLSRLWRNVVTLREKYGYDKDWAAKRHLLNNNMWLQGLTVYDFTKRLARHARIGPMLSRDTVKRKMTEGDGMSLGEFMYPLFQGWDFWHMYNKLGIQMQIGGSDQYGNIVAGIDALKIIRESEEAPHAKMPTDWQHEPMGFTVPLLLDSAGVKFGKSAGNAVWLDEFKTSAFDLYGYFMRRTDDEVEKLLKLFTFMPMSKVQETMTQHRADPSKRVAQHTLAFEVLSLVHGSQKALQEAQQHKFRFGGELPHIIKEPTEDSGIITQNNAPRSDIQLPQSVMKLSPAKILFATGLASSNSDAQRLVSQQGAYVAAQPGQTRGLVPGNLSWTPIKMWFPEETSRYLIDEKILILRKGKHNVRIVEIVSDEEWAASGKIYPGQAYTGVVRRMTEQLEKEAEAAGQKLTPNQLKKLLKERASEQQALKVANNPDIELPSKQEIRQRKNYAQDRRGRQDKSR